VVQDLGAAPVWIRLAAVVGQLHVLAVVSVPIRLASQPVGTLDVYSTQPRAWTTHELEGAGEFARVAGELVNTSVELAAQKLEVAQLRQALTSRIWIEQAKGVLAATQGIDPEVAFQQLRARARSSSRKLAEVAQEVVQDAQRQRLAALALDDARVRKAEARAKAAEQALEAAQTDLTQRRAVLDQAQVAADGRDRIADEREGPPMRATVSLMNATASPTNATGRLATRTDLHAGAGLEAARHSTSQSPMGRVLGP
jgi:ANTAR domain